MIPNAAAATVTNVIQMQPATEAPSLDFLTAKIICKITSPGATIIIEQDLIALDILPGLDLPTLYHYKYQTESSVVQPAEMIRNTDFVYEIAEPYLDKATSELSNVVKKFKTVFDRIDIINKK